MSLHLRLFFTSIIVVLVCLGGNLRGQEPIEIDELWKARITVSQQPHFDTTRPGFYRMNISPTYVDGIEYVPYDLTDAWRELGKMLPADFVRQAEATLDEESCTLTNDDLYDIEQSLEDYLFSNWFLLNQQPTRFAQFVDTLLAVYPRNASDYDYYSLTSNLVVCGYLKYVRYDEFPTLGPFVEFYQQLIRQEFRGIRRVPK